LGSRVFSESANQRRGQACEATSDTDSSPRRFYESETLPRASAASGAVFDRSRAIWQGASGHRRGRGLFSRVASKVVYEIAGSVQGVPIVHRLLSNLILKL